MSARGRPKSPGGASDGGAGEEGGLLSEVLQDSEVQQCTLRESKWASRVLTVSREVSGCTYALEQFSAVVEAALEEVGLVNDEAQALIKLNIPEFKKKREQHYQMILRKKEEEERALNKPSSAAGKGRKSVAGSSSRPTSSRSGRVSLFAGADGEELADSDGRRNEELFLNLENMMKTLTEEKKRTKISNTLRQFYTSDCSSELKPLLKKQTPIPGDESPFERSLNAAGNNMNSIQESKSLEDVASAVSEGQTASAILQEFLAAEEVSKPKEVPTPLWDEVCLLRARRLYLEVNELQPNTEKVREQSERFKLLEENYNLSLYALEAATRELEKVKERVTLQRKREREIKESMAAAEAAAEGGKASARSGSAKKKKK
ncbi:hypothetical protein AGDE_17188 [Angomonas deanei]|uniref:Uncharacterized protein n=1 Tax=Angomonas deanei TaxID=59799 RepID=A0A7G2CGP1_9TRYP|nr:hypothetical protein AGDE_17188 [Angomonas deanei]CAD2218141.1 hypothetical protein, conserved [Angomonas deanei]|eukprot:EPY15082.1 hypothetical protein AGDE_17188 [Angomonas deanei]